MTILSIGTIVLTATITYFAWWISDMETDYAITKKMLDEHKKQDDENNRI